MIGMKLPGKLKYKKVILLVLIILVILILLKTAIDNKKEEKKVEDTKVVEEINSINFNKDDEEVKVEEVTREDELYQEAFGIFHSSQYELAITKANGIIDEFPESYKAYNIRGIAKAFNGSFDEGMKDIDKALEIDPNYGYARFNKALNYELYGNYEESLSWYDKALEVEEYLWSYYGKASIYGRYGDANNTAIYLKKALDIAEKEGIRDSVIEEAKNEADFNLVRESQQFKDLIQ